MEEKTKKFKITKEVIKKWVEINLGLILAAIAIGAFLDTKGLVAGGTSGLSILLRLVFKLPLEYFYYAINIVLLIVSFFAIGKEYFIKTLYSSFMLPTLVMLVGKIINWTNLYDTFANMSLFITVFLGSTLLGMGIGLNLRNDGSTGGMDIVQSILFKYFHVPYSLSNTGINLVIILIGAFVTNVELALAAVIYIVINSYIIDSVTFGGFDRRAVYIKTSKTEEVKNLIFNSIGRGCSAISMHGGYSNEEGQMLLCVCLSREYLELRQLTLSLDPQAFIFVTRATEVRGIGFTEFTEEKLLSLKNKKRKK